MFRGMVHGVIEIKQMIIYRFDVVGLTGNNIKTNVVQVIYQGGGVGHISE